MQQASSGLKVGAGKLDSQGQLRRRLLGPGCAIVLGR